MLKLRKVRKRYFASIYCCKIMLIAFTQSLCIPLDTSLYIHNPVYKSIELTFWWGPLFKK
ncbi:hypothetical protein Pint_18398 [Pistacia integerrima]|uniref:Uncharacterized protein n=1 Tax=Pistacia integerrima TaxID=434235 RepID=A0ACC0YUW6_9ROSI|nr:hypothetical protein Pint_18398 [Pistacia integerrima]